MSAQFLSAKNDYRQFVLDQNQGLETAVVSGWSVMLEAQLHKALSTFNGLWGAYKPLASEPQIQFDQLNKNIQWAYPKVTSLKTTSLKADKKLDYYKNVKNWMKSSLKVLEPVDGEHVLLQDLKGVIVPALAYHTSGHRLGRGAGYYDQSFKNYKGYKIGLCFDQFYNQDVPFENHDLLVDYVVTEKNVYKLKNTLNKGEF